MFRYKITFISYYNYNLEFKIARTINDGISISL